MVKSNLARAFATEMNRRNLHKLVLIFGLAGLVVAIAPFILSLAPAKKPQLAHLQIDISELRPGTFVEERLKSSRVLSCWILTVKFMRTLYRIAMVRTGSLNLTGLARLYLVPASVLIILMASWTRMEPSDAGYRNMVNFFAENIHGPMWARILAIEPPI